jgi:hypothetical protein
MPASKVSIYTFKLYSDRFDLVSLQVKAYLLIPASMLCGTGGAVVWTASGVREKTRRTRGQKKRREMIKRNIDLEREKEKLS